MINYITRNYRRQLLRIIEPVLLGSTANLLVNYVFNPEQPAFDLTEFIVACTLAVPVIELNRWVDRKLERWYNWIDVPLKRILLHFLILASTMCFVLNLVGHGYLIIANKGFFTLKETITINLATLVVAAVLTFFRWTMHFHRQWMQAHEKWKDSETTLLVLKKNLERPEVIELHKGHAKLRVNAASIRLVKLESGIPRVYLDSGEKVVYPGTMKQLAALLPEHLFYLVTRDAIVHRDVIDGVASATFGKVTIHTKVASHTEEFTVSRLKASAFRKWLNSI